MASKKIKGITVEIGGDTTKLGAAIESVTKKTMSLQGELKHVDKLLKMDPGNTELLAQKQKILTEAVSETTEKLKILREAEAQVVAQFERGEIGADQLRSFQREISKTEIDLKSFESQLDDAGDSLEDVGDSAEKSGDGFTVMKGALADLTSNVIQGALSMIGDLVGSLFDLSEATEEYRTMQAKLQGSSEAFGYSIDYVGDKYEKLYKYLGDDQMSANAITNLLGLGESTENLDGLVDSAIATWSAYGDSIPIEALTESIAESINVSKITGSLADTINWVSLSNEKWTAILGENSKAQKAFNEGIAEGLPLEDAFNLALSATADQGERTQMVTRLLNETYGESKKTYDELNQSVLAANEAELQLKDTQAELGEAMAPVNTAITNLKNQALEAVLPLVEKLAKKFLELNTWAEENPDKMQIVTGVVIALATAFGVLATAPSIQGLIGGVTTAFAALNGVFSVTPIGLVITLITGLVAGFLYLWNNCEAFRNFWIGLWDTIVNNVKSAWASIQAFTTKTIPKLIDDVGAWFNQLPGKIWAALLTAIDRVVTWGNNLKAKGKEAGTKLFNAVVDEVKKIPSKMKEIGKDIVEGIWNGIKGSISWITGKVKTFASDILDGMKKALDIQSPSKKMEKEVGEQIANGVIKGVENKKENAKKSAAELAELYVSAGKSRISELKKLDEITLADEVIFWENIKNEARKGTEGYTSAVYELELARKNLNDKVGKLNEEYSTNVSKIQEQLEKDIKAVTDAYDKAIADRQRQIASSMGLFDVFTAAEGTGKIELVANLKSQVNALKEWDQVLDSLANREGMDEGLLSELENMGVSSINTLKQINAMTEAELSAYIALYQEKQAVALERSRAEHEVLKAESDAQIAELIQEAEENLDKLEATYVKELKAIGVTSNKESVKVGTGIVQGMIAGIDSQISTLRAKMAELAAITAQTAQAELEINSPSKVFADKVGAQIPAGIAQGILANSELASEAVKSVTGDMINGATIDRQLATTFGGVSGGAAEGGTSLFDKLDMIYDRLDRLQIVLDTGTLVGETIDKIDSGLANRQLLYARGV